MTRCNITIPVFNEEVRLARCIPRLHQFLSANLQLDWEIVVASNGSTDRTEAVARQLSRSYGGVHVVHIPEKGRGGALKAVWLDSRADVLSYMDVDLATGLEAFPALIEAVASGGFDLATGSRLLPGARVTRGWKREAISRSYNLLLKALLRTRFSDAQCGFKAITKAAAGELLPLVEDTGWFFDTELLVLAEKLGCRICDIPVRWIDDPDSRVKILKTALADIRGLVRLQRNLREAKDRCRAPRNNREAFRLETAPVPNKHAK